MFQFNLNSLSKYRTPLMGIAAIMIIVCHTAQYGVVMPVFLRKLVIYGNLGVDIFLFLSGIGCYYSLNKNTDLKEWYKKRFYRIFIPYLIIQIPFWIYYYINGTFDFLNELFIFTTIPFWTQHVGAWYVALLIPLYIITPFIHSLLNKKHKIIATIIIIGTITLFCNIDINNICNETTGNIQWAFSRIPSFIIGMLIAPLIKREYKVSIKTILLFTFLSVLLYISVHHFISDDIFMWWCLTLPITIFLSILTNIIQKKLSSIYKFISWMGIVSLESYLANIYLCKLFKEFYYDLEPKYLFNGHYIEYLFIIFFGIFISYAINKISKRFL